MNLVLGFIDTPEGWAAARHAVSEAKLRDARIVVVNSMRGGHGDDGAEYVATDRAVESLGRMLDDEGVEYEVHEYVRGMSPSEDLVAASRDFGAQVIVIGIRRRSTTGKVLLGSNALEVLHDADVPVICVKAEEDA